eukprot:355993-Chlamydomonas_euryale.AAC.19
MAVALAGQQVEHRSMHDASLVQLFLHERLDGVLLAATAGQQHSLASARSVKWLQDAVNGDMKRQIRDQQTTTTHRGPPDLYKLFPGDVGQLVKADTGGSLHPQAIPPDVDAGLRLNGVDRGDPHLPFQTCRDNVTTRCLVRGNLMKLDVFQCCGARMEDIFFRCVHAMRIVPKYMAFTTKPKYTRIVPKFMVFATEP